jgi:hypothetical protein
MGLRSAAQLRRNSGETEGAKLAGSSNENRIGA